MVPRTPLTLASPGMNGASSPQPLYSPSFGLHPRAGGGAGSGAGGGSGGGSDGRAAVSLVQPLGCKLACPLRVLVVASCPLSAATIVHYCEVRSKYVVRTSCTTARHVVSTWYVHRALLRGA